MPTLHRIYVGDASIDEVKGITTFPASGDAVEVGGSTYVKIGSGLHVSDGFVESEAAAVIAAADRIERLGNALLSQAARMRQEAGV